MTGCDISDQLAERILSGEETSNFSICDSYKFTDIDDLHEAFTDDEIHQAFLEHYVRLNSTELSDLAHHPMDTIKACFLMGIVTDQCKRIMDMKETTRVFTPRYGVCYLYNFERLNSEVEPDGVGSSGPDYGLKLVMDVQGLSYMRYGLSPTNGIQITLNDPNAMPMILSKPIKIAPNIQTDIKLLKKVVTRQPYPYVTDCTNEYPLEYQADPTYDFVNMNYDEEHCKAICRLSYVHKNCGCLDLLLMEGNFLDLTHLDNLTFCNVIIDSVQRDCSITMMRESAKGQGNCPCKPACYVQSYSYTKSETVWPSDQYWGIVAEDLGITYKGQKITYKDQRATELSGGIDEGYNQIKNLVQNNLMEVTIYYGSLNVEEINEVPEFTFLTFLSDLGGALSLYLGICFIQVFEVLELCIKLVWYAISKILFVNFDL